MTAPLSKKEFNSLIKKNITTHWYEKLCQHVKNLPSLKFLCCAFLPLGGSPHLIWTTCGSSPSAVRSASVQAQLLSGRYRSDYLMSKWSGDSGACTLPGCNKYPDDIVHLLSGDCTSLRAVLVLNLTHGISSLLPFPQLLSAVRTALEGDSEIWVQFLLDPFTDPQIIKIKQDFGLCAVKPILTFTCSYIWCMHRNRMRKKGL